MTCFCDEVVKCAGSQPGLARPVLTLQIIHETYLASVLVCFSVNCES
jgi:hypothetical protein